jgi:hypothetical protein
MKVAAYIKREDSITLSDLICRCCGNRVYVLSDVQESICNFCEAYVSMRDKDVVHGNRGTESNLALMQNSAMAGKWEDGVAPAEALAATRNPYFLYGAASFYRFFSDHTYYGVDYTLEGFMYGNAEKRSSEPQNKHNAMALISKSREFLFAALKIINDTQNPEDPLLFIKFMANVKLGRKVHAQKALAEINSAAGTDMLKLYANIVASVSSGSRLAEKYLNSGLSYGISNTLYYLAMHAAMQKDIGNAIRILDPLAVKSNMPAALYLGVRLKDVRNASEI